uniref:AlNc14C124G6757 protein n=1 Tax=Albugo laibachii Nc14 TaxID=890382 RepID=F0WJN2_9STRA|nr:AlNc14C124G6757 [Albugo laibachii Nc14]|eukprot:CCA21482.1 AlNc14C124G6757 [Albugo laibachii Nc14]
MNNLLSCCEKLYLAIGSNHAEYDASRQRQQMRICNYAQPTPQGMIFQNIKLRISHFELNKIYEQLNLASQPQKTKQVNCMGFFNTVWGLPCSHKLRLYLDQEQDLQLSDTFSDWHLAKPQQLRPLLSRPEKKFSMVLDQVRSSFGDLPDHQQIVTLDELDRLSQQTPKTLQEPVIVRSKGRPRQRIGSMRRDFQTTNKRSCRACGEQGHRSDSKKCKKRKASAEIRSDVWV